MNSHLLFDFIVDKENNTIHMTREFQADLQLVWAAWTTATLLDQWWGPKPWRAETKSMDFREGGYWLYAMVGPEGEKHWGKCTYISIEKEKSFTQNDNFCDENAVENPAFAPNIWKIKFDRKENKVEVDVLISFETLADLEAVISMGFKEGMTTDFSQLDELLKAAK